MRRRFQYEDMGTVARYFQCPGWALEQAIQLAAADPVTYVTKAKQPERHAGLEGFFWKKDRNTPIGYAQVDRATWKGLPKKKRQRGNVHPCVKPIALTLWLARLLLPPAEYAPRRLLVPFSGSSSEMIGALLAGWEWIEGIELVPTFARLGRTRITWWEQWADALNITDPAEVLAEYRARRKAAQADDDPAVEIALPLPRPGIEQLGLWA
jgi:hypothetical protein